MKTVFGHQLLLCPEVRDDVGVEETEEFGHLVLALPGFAGFQQTAEAIDQLPVLFVDGAVPDRETLRPVKRHEANLPVRTVRAALDIKD
jgi:hypothetical protein